MIYNTGGLPDLDVFMSTLLTCVGISYIPPREVKGFARQTAVVFVSSDGNR